MAQTNYVDEKATRTQDLGPCRCPVEPRPHVNDSAEVVTRLSFAEKGRVRQAGRIAGQEAAMQVAILIAVRSWTLVLPDGSARPITAEEIARLDELTVSGYEHPVTGDVVQEGLLHAIDRLLDPEDPLPNGSGAPSPDGPQESATPTQTTPAPPSSTST